MAQILGRYHIISELGRGGMGVVYKALDPKLERFIAIKCLNEELSEDEIVVARFLREARNVAALNHPNIAQVFLADEHDGKPYFVMEYVDGESLSDFIDREGQCSPEMARRVTEQAANALAAAASEGIVHRDVKPGNIMIDRRGRAVLTDFGIACSIAEQADSGGSSAVMGTVGYLPPEALTGEAVDSRGDMFSLGAVYYEMLTGERLIDAHGIKDSFARLAEPEFPDLSALDGRVDERVIKILRRLLAVRPEDRFADWPELLSAMAPLKTGDTGPVERPDSGPSTAEREVTQALATARLEEAGQVTPDATVAMGTVPPDSPPVASGSTRKGNAWAALALIVVAVLLLAAGGYGLARVAPDAWQRAVAWMPGYGSDDGLASDSVGQADTPLRSDGERRVQDSESSFAGTDVALRVSQAVAVEDSADQHAVPDDVAGAAEVDGAAAVTVIETSEAGAVEEEPGRVAPDSAEQTGMPAAAAVDGFAEAELQPALEVPPARTESDELPPGVLDDDRRVARVETAAVDHRRPTVPAAAPPPRGIVVIGVGDPVLADPMVREIESALRAAGQPLVERGFVSGYRHHVEGEEVDLGGLAGPSLAAGARYAIVVRALPAGERELSYYGRIETAFIAQLEAQTFDLHEMRQMGVSPIEQIEFTSLNATERAVASVRPWLPGIRAQFE